MGGFKMLTMNEVEILVSNIKHGDKPSLLKLVEHYKPFIEKAVNKVISLNAFDKEDLMQVGYASLIKSLNKYKLGSYSFCSYAYRAITNEIKYTVRSNVKHNNISINKNINNNDKIQLLDLIKDDTNLEDILLTLEDKNNVRQALKILDKKELELIVFIFYSNHSLKDYSKENIYHIKLL